MANPKLFISIPMRGYDDDEVRAAILGIKEFTERMYDREFDLIDSFIEEEPPDGVMQGAYYLGKSIQKLSTADICVFHPEWKNARGCIIEHMVCAMYDIPYVELKEENSSEMGDYHD